MADRPVTLTRHLTRNKLAQFLNNQEAIKALEDLTKDVSGVLPDAALAAMTDAERALAIAQAALALAGQAMLLVGEAGGDDGGGAGPPGPQGAPGAPGAVGPQGPGGGVALFYADDAPDPEPGPPGPIGSTGAQGPMGPAVFLEADRGDDGDMGPPGPMGAAGATGLTGSQGPTGPAVYLEAEPGDEGPQGPQGVPGAPGSNGSPGTNGVSFWLVEDPIDPDPPIPGARGADGAPGAGGSGASGTAVVNFGAFPGASDASVTVTGQATIGAGSEVNAWIALSASADHSADEHMVETIRVLAGNIVPGTGFTIYALHGNDTDEPQSAASRVSPLRAARLYGQWNINWSWI